MRVFKHAAPLYFTKLNIVVAKDFKIALEKLKLPYSLDPSRYQAFVYPAEKALYVFVRKKTNGYVIAHESIHIANYIFQDVHIKLDIENDEPYAYSVSWAYNQI